AHYHLGRAELQERWDADRTSDLREPARRARAPGALAGAPRRVAALGAAPVRRLRRAPRRPGLPGLRLRPAFRPAPRCRRARRRPASPIRPNPGLSPAR